MTKGILTLYVDNELKILAKSKGINLSSFFNNVLNIEINNKKTKKDKSQRFKNKIALLIMEINKKNKEIEILKKKTNKPKYIDTGITIRGNKY